MIARILGQPQQRALPGNNNNNVQPHHHHHQEDMTADEIGDGDLPNNNRIFRPLDSTAYEAIQCQIDRMIAGENIHKDCFICEYQELYNRESARSNSPMLAACYGYKLMAEFHRLNPQMPPVLKSKHLNRIYTIHIYNPAYEANGDRPPKWLPKPNIRVMLEHLLYYNDDPVVYMQMCLHNLRDVLLLASSQAVVDGAINTDACRVVMKASSEIKNLSAQIAKITGNTSNVSGFGLDQQQVMAFAGPAPLQVFANRAQNALGGAASNDNEAVVTMVTAHRPIMGNFIQSADEGDDDDDDDDEDEREGEEAGHANVAGMDIDD
jgi:hypothetical protein